MGTSLSKVRKSLDFYFTYTVHRQGKEEVKELIFAYSGIMEMKGLMLRGVGQGRVKKCQYTALKRQYRDRRGGRLNG